MDLNTLGLLEYCALFDDKDFVVRERTAIEVVQFGILLYLKGLSFRAVRSILVYLGREISHVAIWKWVQRFGRKVKSITFLENGDMPSIIVVDETCIQIGNKEFYLYAAICPETRRIIYFDLYPMRNYLATFSFFKAMTTFYGKTPELVIIDGGSWYPAALSRLGIKYQVVSGDIRNYVERWYETLKDRLRGFDIYFPHKKCFEHVLNWLYAFVYFYNRIRNHMSLEEETPYTYYKEVIQS